MALNENLAVQTAKEVLLALVNSASLRAVGPYSGSGSSATEDGAEKLGKRDAIYFASFYRELVQELQK